VRPRWLRLVLESGEYNPRVRKLALERSGAYAVRERDSHRVMYVGESSCGKLWKTMIRHFQAPESFSKVRERGVFRRGAQHYEVAIWPTSKGNRRCTRQGPGKNEPGDQKALDAQAQWIERLRPELNADDGLAEDDSFDFGANVRDDDEHAFAGLVNPGTPRVVVDAPPERRAENRTPDLFTGRTRLDDKSGKGRRDWKGEAERLARELAECRRAPVPRASLPPPPPAPVSRRPEGYGETDERGQARMFRRNPLHSFAGVPSFLELVRVWGNAYGDGSAPRASLPRGAYKIDEDDDGEMVLAVKPSSSARRVIAYFDELEPRDAKRVASILGHVAADPVYRNLGEKVLTVAEKCPDPPKEGKHARPWKDAASAAFRAGLGNRAVAILDWDGGKIGDAEDGETARGIALGMTFADLGALARKIGVTARTAHPEALMRLVVDEHAKNARKIESLEARKAKGGGKKGSEELRAEIHALMRREGLLDLLAEVVRAFESHAEPGELDSRRRSREEAAAAELERRTQKAKEDAERVLREIDPSAFVEPSPSGGPPFYGHAIARDGSPIATGKADDQETAYLRLIDRLFDVRQHAREASERRAAGAKEFRSRGAAYFRRPAPARKPAGYGDEVTSGKRAGQLKMFNPRGPLTNLGALTELVGRDLRTKRVRVMRWPVTKAPTLAYDKDGRLFIVYGARVERPTTAKESAEYRRTHWGRRGRGVLTSGGVAVAPFRRVMAGESITYTTEKGTDSGPVDYVHAWGEGARGKWLPPIVVEHECHPETCRRGAKCAAKGAIALMGGTYKVNDRGIVG
jgi:hypothetical protein